MSGYSTTSESMVECKEVAKQCVCVTWSNVLHQSKNVLISNFPALMLLRAHTCFCLVGLPQIMLQGKLSVSPDYRASLIDHFGVTKSSTQGIEHAPLVNADICFDELHKFVFFLGFAGKHKADLSRVFVTCGWNIE